MKIVLAPDSFKESLDSKDVARCMKQGILNVFDDVGIVMLPIAEGGEGTLDVVYESGWGTKIKAEVLNAYHENTKNIIYIMKIIRRIL